jgi:pimeloyl-ACP methyl ester carboxylesterase
MAGPLSAAPRDLFELTMDDGAAILVRGGGNPSGTRLFLSNGNGFAIDGYRVFWEPLLADFEVVLFDMRNHGRNPPTGADGHTYRQMARDIGTVFKGVSEHLGRKASAGVFHSMSARAAMKHAVQMEWVWDALVLFDPPNVPLRGHGLWEAMRGFEWKLAEWAVGRRDSFASPEELRDYWATNRAQRNWTDQGRADMAEAVLRPDGQGGYTLACRRELEAMIYLAALSMDLWPPASAFGGPVKLIGADPDLPDGSPIGAANRALATEGGYEYEAVEKTGHLLQIERPEQCRQAMLSFLRKHALA